MKKIDAISCHRYIMKNISQLAGLADKRALPILKCSGGKKLGIISRQSETSRSKQRTAHAGIHYQMPCRNCIHRYYIE